MGAFSKLISNVAGLGGSEALYSSLTLQYVHGFIYY